jgi:membrane protease YdiL (CAAX protease family)
MNVDSGMNGLGTSEQPTLAGWRLSGVIGILLSTSILFAYIKGSSGTHLVMYLGIIAFDVSLLALVLGDSDSCLREQITSLVQRPRSLFFDLIVAAGIWLTWTFLSRLIVSALGSEGWGSAQEILPNTRLELAVWMLLSLSAGVSEEIVFRGYLHLKLRALTGLRALGILGQAVLFGASHGYQGWKNIVLITVLGMIYGVAVWMRKGLRANVIAHTSMDIGGVFGF